MLHEVHQGMTAMKAIARSYFWWPGLDEDIEMTARQCVKCAQNSKHPPATAAKPWPTTSKPWSRLHIDYAGPFMDTNFLIIVDSFSKWVDVKITKNTSSSTTIELLRDVFATHGLPDTIVSDNGRNFVSDEFKSFLKANGIIHICTAPYHPSSNGQAERFVQTVKNHLKKMPPSNMKKNIANLLLRLRTTPTVNSNQSPAKILMGRRLKTVFSHVYPDIKPNQQQVEPDKPVRSFKTGDDVWYRNFGKGERWLPGTIQTTGSRNYEVSGDGKIQARHIDPLRNRISGINTPIRNEAPLRPLLPAEETEQHVLTESASSSQEASNSLAENTMPEPVAEESRSTEVAIETARPTRVRKAPKRYDDYLMGEELLYSQQ